MKQRSFEAEQGRVSGIARERMRYFGQRCPGRRRCSPAAHDGHKPVGVIQCGALDKHLAWVHFGAGEERRSALRVELTGDLAATVCRDGEIAYFTDEQSEVSPLDGEYGGHGRAGRLLTLAAITVAHKAWFGRKAVTHRATKAATFDPFPRHLSHHSLEAPKHTNRRDAVHAACKKSFSVLI